MVHQNKQSELLTVHEVAQQLRVDDTTVRRWIKQGILEAIHLPHRGKRESYRIKRETLDKVLATAVPAAEVA
jgi:excisionase family DNA binding protein